jgi:hypothetical protein
MRSMSATEVPPNFITRRAMAVVSFLGDGLLRLRAGR